MQETIEDPVVAEVRDVRARIAAEAGYDLNVIYQRLRERSEARVGATSVAKQGSPSSFSQTASK